RPAGRDVALQAVVEVRACDDVLVRLEQHVLDDALDLVDRHGRVEPRSDLRVHACDDLVDAAPGRRVEVAVDGRERLGDGGADAGVVERAAPPVPLEDLQRRGRRGGRCFLVELDGAHRTRSLCPPGLAVARGCATARTPTCGVWITAAPPYLVIEVQAAPRSGVARHTGQVGTNVPAGRAGGPCRGGTSRGRARAPRR